MNVWDGESVTKCNHSIADLWEPDYLLTYSTQFVTFIVALVFQLEMAWYYFFSDTETLSIS